MTAFERQHPLAIVHAFSRYILLLLLPLLRSLLLLRGDVVVWAKGAWLDILVLMLVVGFGVAQWLCTTYALQSKGMYVESGVLFNEARYIPYANLSSAVMERPFYLRPFRIVRMRLETDSGSPSRADVSLLLRESQARTLVEKGTESLAHEPVRPGGETEPKVYRPRPLYIAILSLITSNSLTGVLFLSTFLSQTGKILGEEFEKLLVHSLTRIVRFLAFNIPPAAVMAAAILLGGWGIAFLINLINHLGFRAVRQGKRLFIEAGFFTRRKYYLAVERINFLTLRQSLLTKLFGFCSAFINCTGYGKEKNELSVLLPAADKADLRRNLRMILPEIRVSERQYHPPRQTIMRFLNPPIWTILGLLAGFCLLGKLFPALTTLIRFFAVMAEIPAVWWLFVKIAAYFHVGIGIRGDICTFYSTFGYAFFTTVLHKDKIAKVEVRQSLFQRMSGSADVRVYTFAETQHHVRVHNLPLVQAEEFLRFLEK